MNTYSYLKKIIIYFSIVLILLSSLLAYLNVENSKQYFEEYKQLERNKYILSQKEIITHNVKTINNIIDYNTKIVKKTLEERLIKRVEFAHKIATSIYEINKDTMSKAEIQKTIIETLRNIKFTNTYADVTTDVYYFIQELYSQDKIIARLLPTTPDKEGTNRADVVDINNKEYVKEFYNIAQEHKEGFVEYMWFKLNHGIKEQYPKTSYVKVFEPYNWVIGYGEYLDDVEKELQNLVIKQIRNMAYVDNNYVFIYQLLDINGGDKFAKMLVNMNRVDLEGKFISDDYKDINGKEFRKEFLKDIRLKGDSFVTYAYKKPNTDEIEEKLSYFYLNEKWNWIIGNGVYVNDFEDKYQTLFKVENEEKSRIIRDSIVFTFVILFLFIIILIIVAKYLNNIILSNEKKQKHKDNLIIQQSKMASMGEMLDNIAHQWRQPLSAITSLASGLKIQKELGVLDDGDIEKTADKIVSSAQHLSQTIEDFRGFLRKDKVLQNFDLISTVEKSLKITEGTFNGISINLESQKNLKVDGYPNELIQAILNILNNAKDVLVEKKIDNKIIEIEISSNDKFAIIKIEDNAGGIPKEYINRIFDSDFTTKGEKGTGIGLYMTKQILKNMGGDIEAYNSDKGAVFKISLPLEKV
ncbi:cache domain-containing protein [Arcobacter sp. FWKO B]|uniref:sensor histidine kinase n=1 Tax=Arcobacter sp. FWKO B TaxID=2593672 RepID=UPI0018A4C7CE|nr:cache domain-containing protein [Arcobacter sp. FWKO B]QOG11848.1 GHKL domain-containing protein [Arcobacter sp. FWKO B]